jgi:hypothetical protein
MKQILTRRQRRTSYSSKDGGIFKKENQQEQSFFGEASHETFFQPASQAIQRKCDKCEEDDKKVSRKPEDKKEEEKKLQRQPEKEEDKKLQKKEDKKEEEDKKLQKKESNNSSNAVNVTGSYVNTLNGKGSAMPTSAQQFFGRKMGYDFSNVKIHTGAEAAQSAKEVNAKAYTIGNNIVFNHGRYDTLSAEGKKLLAHELAHVMQQDTNLNRKSEEEGDKKISEEVTEEVPAEEIANVEEEELSPASTTGTGTLTDNKVAYGDCQGINVQGRTVANYDHGTYSVTGAGVTRAKNCSGCTGDDCVTISGTIVSDFHANPVVTLPGVPSGLNACEQQAVQNFINTTLNQHEQQHVSAFNTYNATINTPFTYRGCRDGMDGHVAGIHNRIDAARIASANALSDALDAGGANNFTITCNCPDPVRDAGAGPSADGGRDGGTR